MKNRTAIVNAIVARGRLDVNAASALRAPPGLLAGGSADRTGHAPRPLRIGDYFGELGLLDGVPRSATVVATGELHVMKIPRQSFLRLAQRYPAIPLEMVSKLGSQIRRLETQPALP